MRVYALRSMHFNMHSPLNIHKNFSLSRFSIFPLIIFFLFEFLNKIHVSHSSMTLLSHCCRATKFHYMQIRHYEILFPFKILSSIIDETEIWLLCRLFGALLISSFSFYCHLMQLLVSNFIESGEPTSKLENSLFA